MSHFNQQPQFPHYFSDRQSIGKGLGPRSICVLNVMLALVNDPAALLFLNNEEYKLLGLMTRDHEGRLLTDEERKLVIAGIKTNGKRFNFDLVTRKFVLVTQEEAPAESQMQWRTYSIIKDGKIHIPVLRLILGEKTYKLFQSVGLISTEKTWRPNRIFEVNIQNMPIVRRAWAQPDAMGLIWLMVEERELMLEQTALNKRIRTDGVEREVPEETYEAKEELVEEQLQQTEEVTCLQYEFCRYETAVKYNYSNPEIPPEEVVARRNWVKGRLQTVRNLQRMIIFAYEEEIRKAELAAKPWPQIIPWGPEEVEQRGRKVIVTKRIRQAEVEGYKIQRITWIEKVPIFAGFTGLAA